MFYVHHSHPEHLNTFCFFLHLYQIILLFFCMKLTIPHAFAQSLQFVYVTNNKSLDGSLIHSDFTHELCWHETLEYGCLPDNSTVVIVKIIIWFMFFSLSLFFCKLKMYILERICCVNDWRANFEAKLWMKEKKTSHQQRDNFHMKTLEPNFAQLSFESAQFFFE